MKNTWLIEARQGFAVGNETLELFDENNALMDLTNLTATMRIDGFGEVSTVSGNFVAVAPVLPATYATAWAFHLTVAQVNAITNGTHPFEVLIGDANTYLLGEILGEITKRPA